MSMMFWDVLVDCIEKNFGVVFAIDYGEEGSFGNMFEVIKDYKFVYVFDSFGEVDFLVYVDFGVLC